MVANDIHIHRFFVDASLVIVVMLTLLSINVNIVTAKRYCYIDIATT
jgi:hypothetical protein